MLGGILSTKKGRDAAGDVIRSGGIGLAPAIAAGGKSGIGAVAGGLGVSRSQGGVVAKSFRDDIARKAKSNGSDPNDPDQINARITRERWQQYKEDFVPVENALLARANGNGNSEANAAGQAVAAAHGIERRNMNTVLAGKGIGLTVAQRRVMERRGQFASSTDIGTAENSTRLAVRDRNQNLAAHMVGVGQNVASGSQAGIGAAASMANQRDMAHTNAKAQADAGRLAAAGTGAAIGFMTPLGPVGAAIGGGIGYMLG